MKDFSNNWLPVWPREPSSGKPADGIGCAWEPARNRVMAMDAIIDFIALTVSVCFRKVKIDTRDIYLG
jgi:hypothetical protein